MTIYEVKEAFRIQAKAHGEATVRGDYKSANRSYDEIVAHLTLIKSFGAAGAAALGELTEDPDEAVMCWSATHLLESDEGKALSVLGPLANKPGPMAFNARMVIQQWRKGELSLPLTNE